MMTIFDEESMDTHEIKKNHCNGYSFLSTWITKTKDNFHGGWHGAWGNDMGHYPLAGTMSVVTNLIYMWKLCL